MNFNKKDCDIRQRFSIRKLTVGVCSILLSTVFFVNTGNDLVHADTFNNGQEKTEEIENKKADSTNELVNKDIISKNQRDEQNNKKLDTQAQTKKINKTDKPQLQAKADNKKENANINELEQKQNPQAAVKAKSLIANKNLTDQVDTSIWKYSKISDGIMLDGLKSSPVVDGKIIVPNTYDFQQAGVINGDQKVYIGAYFRRNTGNAEKDVHDQYGKDVREFIISHNGNGKAYATGDWGDAFNGVQYDTMDLTNMDVSDVTQTSQMFCFTNLEKIIGLDTWDVSKVMNMGSMFYVNPRLQDVGDLSKWNTSSVTYMGGLFSLCQSLSHVGDLSSWNVSNVHDFHQAFAKTALSKIDLHGWDLSNADNVDHMFTGSIPVIIDLRGAKLPTKTEFKILDFASNKPMVVYSDENSKLFELNNAKLNEYFDGAVGEFLTPGIGHQTTNYLSITYIDENGKEQKLGTIPLNFVFANKDAIISEMKEKTEQAPINDLIHAKIGANVNAAPSDFTVNPANGKLTLKHDFNKAALKLVTDTYILNTVGQEYTQEIIYKDKTTDQAINSVNVTGNLSTSGTARISNSDIVKDINDNLPKNYHIVSGLPTSDITINSTKPDPIVIVVSNAASVKVIYQDEQGTQVGTQIIDGKVGETSTLNLTIPDGYEIVGLIPSSYTFTNNADQQLIVPVKLIEQKTDQDNGEDNNHQDNNNQNNQTPPVVDNHQDNQTSSVVNDDRHQNTSSAMDKKPAKSSAKTSNSHSGRVSANRKTSSTNYSRHFAQKINVKGSELPQTGSRKINNMVAVLGGMVVFLGLAFLEKSKRKNTFE